jgi:outer membrane protein
MATDNLGVGVLGAWPFKHDIKGAGALAGAGKIGEVKHLPPTVTLQYHFAPDAAVRPFVGAGFNYTTFFSEKTTGALAGADLKLDDSFGWALEAGVDYSITPDWFVSGQLYYIAIDTTAKVNGAKVVNVDINPWVFMLSGGRRF